MWAPMLCLNTLSMNPYAINEHDHTPCRAHDRDHDMPRP